MRIVIITKEPQLLYYSNVSKSLQNREHLKQERYSNLCYQYGTTESVYMLYVDGDLQDKILYLLLNEAHDESPLNVCLLQLVYI